MPNKTAAYQLNQWEPEDDFLRTDFNEDNARLEAALAGLEKDKCHIRAGYYYGNGAASQHIDLGFPPQAVILSTRDGKTSSCNSFSVSGGVYVRLGEGITDLYPGMKLDDTGFTVYSNGANGQATNTNSVRYHYVAFQ